MLHVPRLKVWGTLVKKSPLPSSTILKLSQCQINCLTSYCSCNESSHSATVSNFQAVSAHIWKVFCMARGLAHNKESRLIFSVVIHSRMSPPLPEYFFGNGCTSGIATARVSEVIGFIPERIREANGQVDDAYIDDLEAADEDHVMNTVPITGSYMFIVSWLGMPCYDADWVWKSSICEQGRDRLSWCRGLDKQSKKG